MVFVCSGHYYCIGECGGANQIAKCAECEAQIGGQQHRLLDNNRLAEEMDHAHHPAFSNEAFMEQFNDL